MNTIERILAGAAGHRAGRVAVAAAQDADVLRAVCAAREQKIAEPILVGDCDKIRQLLRQLGQEPESFELIPAEDDADSARKAVDCVATGQANLLMKGLMNTADLMRAVIDPEHGLRTGRLISHVMLYQPAGHRMMALSDGGMNPFPDLEKKAQILENAAAVLRALGYTHMAAACICGAETVNPKIQAMVDAQKLTEMKERWAPYHMEVYGPVGLDLAVSREACQHKGYTAPGGGEADILLVPTYEVGNAMGKAMSIFGNAKNAGIIVGAAVPIILVSRSDSAETKLASIALGAVIAFAAEKENEKEWAT